MHWTKGVTWEWYETARKTWNPFDADTAKLLEELHNRRTEDCETLPTLTFEAKVRCLHVQTRAQTRRAGVKAALRGGLIADGAAECVDQADATRSPPRRPADAIGRGLTGHAGEVEVLVALLAAGRCGRSAPAQHMRMA